MWQRPLRAIGRGRCRARVGSTVGGVELADLQELIADTYGERDRARGVPATVAWLASLAVQLDLGLEEAAPRYAGGCPRCGMIPCDCP
jgi:hypothetical protein